MRQIISDRIASNRLSAQLIAIFAGLALMLAAVGIYGVLSFTVGQRTHEIGLRMALGAARGQVLERIVGEAAMLAGAGIAIGARRRAGADARAEDHPLRRQRERPVGLRR